MEQAATCFDGGYMEYTTLFFGGGMEHDMTFFSGDTVDTTARFAGWNGLKCPMLLYW